MGGVFMGTVLLIMLGGIIGFFTAALCKAASRADENMQMLETQENNIGNFIIPEVKPNTDLIKEIIDIEKETLI
jgi:hypothetical protein